MNAIYRPKAWHSYKFEVVDHTFLAFFLEWQVVFNFFAANRGVCLIAQSMVVDNRFQSCGGLCCTLVCTVPWLMKYSDGKKII